MPNPDPQVLVRPEAELGGIRIRGREISRLEAFSDGVFAFAVTLLVVSLDVPKGPDELMAIVRGLPAFAICFGMLVYIWWLHHAFFRRYGLHDVLTVILNAVLLFVVVFYVYPLKFIFTAFLTAFFGLAPGTQRWEFDDLAKLFLIYAAGFVAVFLSFALLYARAYAQRDKLGLSPIERFNTRAAIEYHLLWAFVGLVSLLLAGFKVGMEFGLPGFAFALLGPLCAVHGVLADRQRKRLYPD